MESQYSSNVSTIPLPSNGRTTDGCSLSCSDVFLLSCCGEHLSNHVLCFPLNLRQMLLPLEAFGIQLVHIFGPWGAGGEPALSCEDFESADGSAVARGLSEPRHDGIAREGGRAHLLRRELREPVLLVWRRRGINAGIPRFAQFPGEFPVEFRGIPARACHHLSGEQVHDDAVLVRGPHRAIPSQ